jgi:TetR/AcrR family transcriptional regulator, transcriptional repressor for nem operon
MMHGVMATQVQAAPDTTRTRILDVAENLVQTRGFNGFSYADIAAEVGLTKASLHYHFATKADLGRTLVARYTEGFGAALERISRSLPDAPAQLRAYVELYSDVLREERLCLCGMVAAEYATLPSGMQEALRVFFEVNERWLARLLEEGQREGTLSFPTAAVEAARMLVGALEGEMLVARAYGDPARFTAAAALLLAQLKKGGDRAERTGAGPRGGSSRPARRTKPRAKASSARRARLRPG